MTPSYSPTEKNKAIYNKKLLLFSLSLSLSFSTLIKNKQKRCLKKIKLKSIGDFFLFCYSRCIETGKLFCYKSFASTLYQSWDELCAKIKL